MNKLEILDMLIELEYSPEYICLAFMLNDDYKDWFLNLINTEKKYKRFQKVITPTIATDFVKTMTDEKVNLKRYFKMKAVLERAERFKAKRHRIECYSRIMNVDIKVAYHLYCLDEKQAENDMWNKVYEETLGADYKEKYPIKHPRSKAYYIDTHGILHDIQLVRDRKQYYLYGEGIRFK